MAGRFPDDPRGGLLHVLAGRITNSQRKGFALAVGRGHGRAVDSDAVLFGCGIADRTGEVHRLIHAESLRRSLRRSSPWISRLAAGGSHVIDAAEAVYPPVEAGVFSQPSLRTWHETKSLLH